MCQINSYFTNNKYIYRPTKYSHAYNEIIRVFYCILRQLGSDDKKKPRKISSEFDGNSLRALSV